jgi:Ca-activated chloride channel family protein
MSFAEPIFLAGLVLVPLALLAREVARRRARRHAVRFTAVPVLELAAAAEQPWLRHLPAALALAALAALVLAIAKPERTVAVPRAEASIVLVTDHSRSMLASDVDPNRLAAAKSAARSFLDELPDRMRVGVVAYSDIPDAAQSPSLAKDRVRDIIDNQVADGATATGDALQAALESLPRERRRRARTPAAIVLLSDGRTTTGRDPVEVAELARRRRVPVFTISLGTSAAMVPHPQVGGAPLPATPDPETLREIAETSGGRAFKAEDDEELSQIYKALGSRLGTREEKREITAGFAAAAGVLLLGAAGLSVRRAARLP